MKARAFRKRRFKQYNLFDMAVALVMIVICFIMLYPIWFTVVNSLNNGQDALRGLQADTSLADAATVRLKAAAALAKQSEWNAQPAKMSRELLAANITVWPKGATLPAGFLAQDWPAAMKDQAWQYPECLRDSGKTCDAYLIDLDTDGVPEVALQLGSGSLGVLKRGGEGWRRIGNLLLPFNCPATREALRPGRHQ